MAKEKIGKGGQKPGQNKNFEEMSDNELASILKEVKDENERLEEKRKQKSGKGNGGINSGGMTRSQQIQAKNFQRKGNKKVGESLKKGGKTISENPEPKIVDNTSITPEEKGEPVVDENKNPTKKGSETEPAVVVDENEEPTKRSPEEKEESEETISDEEWKEFVDKGIVSDDTISNIAGKIKEHVKLSKREQAIYINKKTKIEERIKKLNETLPPSEISIEKINTFESLMKELEEQRQKEFENGPQSARIKKGVMDGVKSWENFGQGEKSWKGFAKRMTKTAVNLALIGAISSVSIQKIAETGIITSAALAGGITHKLVMKLGIGLGFGSIMDAGGKMPEKVKKFLPKAIMVGSVALAVGLSISGGAVVAMSAGAIAGLSMAVGVAASKLKKGWYTDQKIEGRKQTAIQKLMEKYEIPGEAGKINLEDIDKFEEEYMRLIKHFENMVIWGKSLDEGAKILTGSIVSAATMFGSSLAHEHLGQHETINKADTNHIKAEKVAPVIDKDNLQHGPITTLEKPITVEFSSRGGIQTVLDMKGAIHHQYPDISKAPAELQEFVKANATQEAIKLGFYNPNDPSGAESINVQHGSTLTFGEKGLSMHDIRTGENQVYSSEHKFEGKMFDSDHSAVKVENVDHTQTVHQDSANILHQTTENHGSNYVRENPLTYRDMHVDKITNLQQGMYQKDFHNTNHGIKGAGVIDAHLHNDTSRHDATFGAKHNRIGHNEYTSKHLTPVEAFHQTQITVHKMLSHVFHSDKLMSEWNHHIKNSISAEKLMEMHHNRVYPHGLHYLKPLAHQMERLEEISGLRPGQILVNGKLYDEPIENFMSRATGEIQKMGKLDQI